jgi:hypothetical protein
MSSRPVHLDRSRDYATGATQWTYAYEPFGATRTETQDDPSVPQNSLKFTGELLDPTGALLSAGAAVRPDGRPPPDPRPDGRRRLGAIRRSPRLRRRSPYGPAARTRARPSPTTSTTTTRACRASRAQARPRATPTTPRPTSRRRRCPRATATSSSAPTTARAASPG